MFIALTVSTLPNMTNLSPSEQAKLEARIRDVVPKGHKKEYSKSGVENIAKQEYKRSLYIEKVSTLMDAMTSKLLPMLLQSKGRGVIEISAPICDEIAAGVRQIQKELVKPKMVVNAELRERPLTLQDVLIACAHYQQVPHVQITKHGDLYMQYDGNKHHCRYNTMQDFHNQSPEFYSFLHSLLIND